MISPVYLLFVSDSLNALCFSVSQKSNIQTFSLLIASSDDMSFFIY